MSEFGQGIVATLASWCLLIVFVLNNRRGSELNGKAR